MADIERDLAEDVYYVSRDRQCTFGINQLLSLPALSAVELTAIEKMLYTAENEVWQYATADVLPPLQRPLAEQEHGLYYVDQHGRMWALSYEDCRPDLTQQDTDWLRAVLDEARSNLCRLRRDARI